MTISMKKIALGLLSLFLVVGSINAQEGKKALKEGSKMLSKYGTNAIKSADQLDEGIMLVEKAFESEDVTSKAKNYNVLGSAYNAVVSGQINAKLLDNTFEITKGELGFKAMDAFKKAYSMTEKKGERKDAVAGLQATEGHLNNVAIYYFQEQNYPMAFDYFNGAIQAYESIKEFGGESRLDDEIERKDHYFYTGAAGFYGKKGDAVIPVLETLEVEGDAKSLVYEALYGLYADKAQALAEKAESDEAKAEADAVKAIATAYLTKGRALHPDDTGLLFAEINHYLKEGQMEVLIEKLQTAMEKEPENTSIIITLGNVFDNLNQTARKNDDIEKADEYFAEALKYYGEAKSKDATNFDAIYSLGALYYNKAASYTDRINELANDFSSAGTKKYNALKAEMDGLFEKAMPHFEEAEVIDPSDLNTLIALKEIHARQNSMDKMAAYKEKIQKVQAGGQ